MLYVEVASSCCRASNAVRALAALQLPIYAAAVAAVVGLADSEEVATPHMLRSHFLALAAAQTAAQRVAEH